MTSIQKYVRLKNRVIAFVKERQAKDGDRLPTFKEIARKFRVNYDTVEDFVHDSDGALDMNVGFRAGGGVFKYESRGQYELEYTGGEQALD